MQICIICRGCGANSKKEEKLGSTEKKFLDKVSFVFCVEYFLSICDFMLVVSAG
jgi:hypothetical protein